MHCPSCNNVIELTTGIEYQNAIYCEPCVQAIHSIPTREQQYKKYIESFRKNHIPERYNQIRLLDELMNPVIDHYISISNRTDGKTFNYTHALLATAIEFETGIIFLSRNMMLRLSYQELLNEVIDKSPLYERKDFNFIRNQYYISLNYKDRTIAIISDLNNATELKYFSSYIKNFPIMVYDEFLALEDDYLSDEWDRLKTIYESIDRVDRVAAGELITKPKIFYFGNAVNFESPVLHGLKIFNILEKHPINTARIYTYEYNVMLEMNRNDNANLQRNTRAFDSGNDAMTTAQFKTNDHNIATDSDRYGIKRNPRVFYVKLKEDYLKVWFNATTLDVILSIESRVEDPYLFNMQLKDNRKDSTYLTEKFFDENHIKKIDRGSYLFDNNFSKNYITSDFHQLNQLKINKLIRLFIRDDDELVEKESKEKQFADNTLEQSKKWLTEKFWG